MKWDKNVRFQGIYYLGTGYVEDGADSRAGTYGTAEWDFFQVGSEATNYRLGIGEQLKRDNWEEDPFKFGGHYGRGFTTKDRDNDLNGGNCASNYYGGWWHNTCYQICLTCNRPSRTLSDGIKSRIPSEAWMWIKKV